MSPPAAKVFLAGHQGMVGSAILRTLKKAGYADILLMDRTQLDLLDQNAVTRFFESYSPETVILCAAKVGGIEANRTQPVEFIEQNLKIQTNVISAANQNNVQNLLFMGSSCIYPRDCSQPIAETSLLTGPLELTNRPYAIAKISGIEMCWAINKQYGARYFAVMPPNIYGPGDNYHLQQSHVIAGLTRRIHNAKLQGEPIVRAWGTGEPRREFLFVDDLADACVFLLNLPKQRLDFLFTEINPPIINVGSGSDLTISSLAETIRTIIGFDGKIDWDNEKPNGTPQKLLSTALLDNLGWKARINLFDGLTATYKHFLREHS